MTLKKSFLFVFLAALSFTIQLNTASSSSANQVKALFLGTGIAHSDGPCNDLGYRVVRHQVKILYLNVGDYWTSEEPCDAGSGVGNPNLNNG